MTQFRWTDRHGVAHDLDQHDEIERERRQMRQELLDLRPRLEHADKTIFMAAHGEAVALRARMAALQDYLQRFIRHEATRADTMIGQIDLDASFLRDLHRSYEQHGERAANEAALVAAPTADQISVLRRQAIRDGTQAVIPAMFGEAHAMLVAYPATCRTPLPPGAPGFEWTDRHMKYHQVYDLRQIEREYVVVAGELAHLRALLAPGIPIRDMLMALEQARVGIDRVAILERAMVRWTAHVIGVARGDHITFLDQLEA